MSRPCVYFDTSVIGWLLDNKNDPAFIQSLKARFEPVVDEYVVMELGATSDSTRRRELFRLLSLLLKGTDGVPARPVGVLRETAKQFYRGSQNVNIAAPFSSSVWYYIDRPDQAEKQECQKKCLQEKTETENWSFEFVRGAFGQKCKLGAEPAAGKWEEEFRGLQTDIDRLIPLIVKPFERIAEEELINETREAPGKDSAGWSSGSIAREREALELEWRKLPLLCSHVVCWLRFMYEVLKTEKLPDASRRRMQRWRKMATDLLQGIHLVRPCGEVRE